jgi:hypothetical protein
MAYFCIWMIFIRHFVFSVFGDHVLRVVFGCSDEKMVGVYARWVVAFVANQLSISINASENLK